MSEQGIAATSCIVITLSLRADDAEPILHRAAQEAAKFSGWHDYLTKRTVSLPCDYTVLDERRKEWNEKFLHAKRIVESFGVEYQMTTEPECLGVYIPQKILKSHLTKIGGITFRNVDKSIPDPKRAMPQYQSAVFLEACNQAAARVVREWRSTL